MYGQLFMGVPGGVQWCTMEYVSKLLGSPARVKLLRLFLFNQERTYDRDDAAQIARVATEATSRECQSLTRAGVLARKSYFKEMVRPGDAAPKRRRTVGWTCDLQYPHREALTRFLRDTLFLTEADIRKRFRGVGTVRLLAISGVLVGERERGIDLLIVGDRLSTELVRSAVRALEAECGQEIRYAILLTDEFLYRRRVRDRLVRDVLDYPHKLLIDRVAGQ